MPRFEFSIASPGYHLQASSQKQVLSLWFTVFLGGDESSPGCPFRNLPVTCMFNFVSSFILSRIAGLHGNQWDTLPRKRMRSPTLEDH